MNDNQLKQFHALLLFSIFCLIAAVFAALYFVAPCQAQSPQTKKVTLIIIDNAISDSFAKDIFRSMRSYSKEVKINLYLNKIVRINEPYPTVYTLDNLRYRVFLYSTYAREAGYNRGGGYSLFLVPPIADRNALWFTGVARTICSNSLNSTAWSTAGAFSISKLPKVTLSKMAATHELFHLLGAYHNEYLYPDGSANIMKSDAGAYPPASGIWGVTTLTKLEIRLCQKF